jgi:hypothetical protein
MANRVQANRRRLSAPPGGHEWSCHLDKSARRFGVFPSRTLTRSLQDYRFAVPRPADNLEVVEHESGPELLLYLAVGTGVLSLAKSVIELVIEVIKSRSAGIKKGDSPRDPLVLIVRRVDEKNDYREEIVLRMGHRDKVDSGLIEKKLNDSIHDLFKDKPSSQ